MQKDKAKELLGINLPANVVSLATGISASQLSQWMGEEEFASEVTDLRIANSLDAANRDKKYNSIEDKLLEKLQEKLENGFSFTSPKEILAAIRIINGAVRRGAPSEMGSGAGVQNVVNLQLPENTVFAARFVMNGKNQVVEVAGRSLATMNARGVVAKLEEKKANEAANTDQHAADKAEAEKRLDNLVRMEHLPVANVL